MSNSLPTSMRALELRSFEGDSPRPTLIEKPLPVPRAGEVLVRVAAAPINPNDLLFLRNQYEVKKSLPVVPGFEGSGTVVGGNGFMARTMLGHRVACAAGEGDGTWAEYMTVPAMRCAPLFGGVELDEGATMLTNPLTAWVLASRARREGHRAVVLTAAAGALGLMLNRLFERNGIDVINVIRSQKQADSLKDIGAAHVLDSSTDDFEAELRARSLELRATLALDAVGGAMTGTLLRALPPDSIVRVYGMLSNADAVIDPADLVFHGKRVEGFTMYEWLKTTSLFGQLYAIMKVQGLVRDALKTHVRARFSLADHEAALHMALSGGSYGKVLLVP